MTIKSYLLAVLVFFGGFTYSSAAQAITWKGIFIAGDDSIDNFDNGREDISQLLATMGDLDAIHFSSSDKFISPTVKEATADNLLAAFRTPISAGEGCFVHMTSHGAKHQGFYLSRAGILPPATMKQMVDARCGANPTVILISACYSGQFVDSLKGPNRIVMTAASSERPSFGCSADTRYTYWDHCLLEELPNSTKWVDLSQRVNTCIQHKEAALGARSSEPQAFFGANAQDWDILQ